MKRICVVGGGNLGHFIVAKLGSENEMYVYTRETEVWNDVVIAEDVSGTQFCGHVRKASQNAEDTVGQAEVIFITWPTNILSARLHEIEPYINKDAWVCLCPGYGGKEFICKSLIEKGVHVFGTQRVFSSTKVLDYGKKVACIDNRPAIHMAAVKRKDLQECRNLLESLFQKKCITYENYMNVSLTPSNPVLHTSRLYSLFCDYEEGKYYPELLKFYSEWDLKSSEVLIACDNEVQRICKSLRPLDMQGVFSLKKHYEIEKMENCSSDEERMTKKIKQLKFLKDQAPMIKTEKGYIPDFESRYFQEDFVFGLGVIQNIAGILEVRTKQIDQIMSWFENLMGTDSLKKGLSAMPQTYGITKKDELLDFYLN